VVGVGMTREEGLRRANLAADYVRTSVVVAEPFTNPPGYNSLAANIAEPARTNELSSHHNCGGRSELSPNLMRDERLQFLPQHRRDPG
jgi:hypothetical protein